MTERGRSVKAAAGILASMRLLGLDVGDRTIGVALSDESATLASGLRTIRRAGLERDLRVLADLARGHEVAEVVVGLPRSLDGSEGPQARKVPAIHAENQSHNNA